MGSFIEDEYTRLNISCYQVSYRISFILYSSWLILIDSRIIINYSYLRTLCLKSPMSTTILNFLPTDIDYSISGIFSSIATTLVIGYSFANYQKLQYIGKMVIILNLSDLFFCLSKLSAIIYEPPDTQYCKFIQIISQSSLLLSAFWGAAFGHSFYILMKYQKTEVAEKYFVYYIYCSSVFVVLGIATYFTDFVVYSQKLQTCVHIVEEDKFDYTYSIFDFLPIFLCCIIGCVYYALGIKKLMSLDYGFEGRNFIALIVYPGIMLVCLCPMIFVGVFSRFGNHSILLSKIVTNLLLLQGFLDAFVYGLLPQIRQFLSRKKGPQSTSMSEGGYESSEINRDTFLLVKKSVFEESTVPERKIENKSGL